MARKPSGMDRRLLAESSRVRSNHWVAAGDGRVQGVASSRSGTGKRSARCAWDCACMPWRRNRSGAFSKGSSTSFRCCSRRMSLDILWALAAMPASTFMHAGVHLPGVGLAGYRIAGGEAHLLLRSSDPICVNFFHDRRQTAPGSLPGCRWFPWNPEASWLPIT